MPRRQHCGNERGSLDLTDQNKVLIASVTDPDGLDAVSYRWKVRTDDGAWMRIDGARGATLEIDDAWAGREVRVTARYRDDDGHRKRHSETFRIAEKPAPMLTTAIYL